MALFLGLMKVAENGGLLKIIAKLLRPLMIRLFPNIPDNHPAMGSIIMNISERNGIRECCDSIRNKSHATTR